MPDNSEYVSRLARYANIGYNFSDVSALTQHCLALDSIAGFTRLWCL